MAPRYAIYFAPATDSALADFGARLLGVNADTGEDCRSDKALLAAFPDWRHLTDEPRRYGFHATLKAPFELAPTISESDLKSEVDSLAGTLQPTKIGPLRVATLGHFIALTPRQTTRDLTTFSAEIVQKLDFLRAALSAHDRARRNPARLTERQCELLDRWGYPYVLDEFRFHMTLTGRLEQGRIEAIRSALEEAYQRAVPDWQADVFINDIAIFKQSDRSARFQILSRSTIGR